MAHVKIFIEEGENLDDVKEALAKSLTSDSHLEDKRYDDPLMNELMDLMDDEYRKMYVGMVKEILDVLKEQ